MIQRSHVDARKVRFGPFEADLEACELHKFGHRIKLQLQPFQLLTILLERPGEVITREELQRRMWGSTPVGDCDHSISIAVNKVREALSDSADHVRYIETVAKRGYKFVAAVQETPTPASFLPTEAEVLPIALPFTQNAETRITWKQGSKLLLVLIAAGMFALAGFWLWPRRNRQAANTVRALTSSNDVYANDILRERFAGIATDGLHIYFSETREGRVTLSYADIPEGHVHRLELPPEIFRPAVADISPDGSKLLVRSIVWPELEQPLWIVPSAGGSANRVFDTLCHDAAWMPDGRGIVYASGHSLWITKNDGRPSQKLATLPGQAFWVRYAPDGSSLRFTLLEATNRATSLWELSVDGKRLRPVLPGLNDPPSECCGSWTPDGKYYVFQSTREGVNNVWAKEENGKRFSSSPARLTQITAGPLSYSEPLPARHGNRIFVVGTIPSGLLWQWDAAARKFVRILPDISDAGRVEFSRDGARVAWISTKDESLWQSRLDGTERFQLTSMRVLMARWSPDGQKLAFLGKPPAGPWKIYLVSRDGGNLQILLDEALNQADPTWSPDGKSLAFGRLPDYMADEGHTKALSVVDVNTKAVSVLPGSEGLFSPRWSPNGRYIAAMQLNQRELMIYDIVSRKWTKLVARIMNNPTWSRNGRYIYFSDFREETDPIYRVSFPNGRVEWVADSRDMQPAPTSFWGLSPQDNPVVSVFFPTTKIYAVDWLAQQ